LDPSAAGCVFEGTIDAASGGLPHEEEDNNGGASVDLVLKTTQKYITVKGRYESALADLQEKLRLANFKCQRLETIEEDLEMVT